MNCQSFDSIAADLARGVPADATAREHANSCAPCAARLTNERALTAGLRSLAEEARAAEAPARVEAALVAAFRAREWEKASAPADARATARPLPVNILGARPRAASLGWLPRWAQGAAVAAASALLVFGLYGLVLKRSGVQTSDRAADTRPSAGTTAAPAERASSVDETTARDPRGTETTDGDPAADESAGVVTASVLPTPRAGRRAGAGRSFEARYGGARRAANANVPAGRAAADASHPQETAEITTDFIPLIHGGLVSADAGHVLRVELPRSALAGFGLPLNAERAGERVKADVLMGDDGIARAIRFVR